MKKKIAIVLSIIGVLVLGIVTFYVWGSMALGSDDSVVLFTIEAGTSKTVIAKNLKKANLIRSEYALDMYLFIHPKNIQAGDYELSRSMTPREMLDKFSKGDVVIASETITLIEGKRLTDYASTLSESLSFTKDEFLNKASDIDFLNTLVSDEDYWFITNDILDSSLYYPLEGYLFPDTYEFLKTATTEEVIKIILNHTKLKLDELKEQITTSVYSPHEILTMASIVESEANTLEDRKMAAQVFYTRLTDGWSLGSDVTAFYGAKKEMGKDSETWDVLSGVNPYNTRLTDGRMNGKLPIGPICSPSLSSIVAALNPSATDYHYFVANICTGEVYFQSTAAEFSAKTKELSDSGCL